MAECGDNRDARVGSDTKLSNEEKLKTAYLLKSEGNEYYKNKNFKQAIGKYHRSLLYLRGINQSTNSILGVLGVADTSKPEISPDLQMEVSVLQKDCHNNLAACMLQQEKPNYEKIVQYCDKVLEVSPNNLKAMYRKGVACFHLEKYENGHSVLVQARDHGKGKQKDPAVEKYLHLCKKEMDKQDRKMKETFKGMFDRMSTEESPQNT